MYSNIGVYRLCNAILVVKTLCYRYSTILITLLRNNLFQRNLVIASAMYWRLSVRNFIQIRSDLTFILDDV